MNRTEEAYFLDIFSAWLDYFWTKQFHNFCICYFMWRCQPTVSLVVYCLQKNIFIVLTDNYLVGWQLHFSLFREFGEPTVQGTLTHLITVLSTIPLCKVQLDVCKWKTVCTFFVLFPPFISLFNLFLSETVTPLVYLSMWLDFCWVIS